MRTEEFAKGLRGVRNALGIELEKVLVPVALLSITNTEEHRRVRAHGGERFRSWILVMERLRRREVIDGHMDFLPGAVLIRMLLNCCRRLVCHLGLLIAWTERRAFRQQSHAYTCTTVNLVKRETLRNW